LFENASNHGDLTFDPFSDIGTLANYARMFNLLVVLVRLLMK